MSLSLLDNTERNIRPVAVRHSAHTRLPSVAKRKISYYNCTISVDQRKVFIRSDLDITVV